MSEKSLMFKIVKYLLIAKICVLIVISFILLLAVLVVTTRGGHENNMIDEVLHYDNESTNSSGPMLGIVLAVIAFEVFIQLLGLIGVIRGNVILLLVFGILVSLSAFYEFVTIFTYDGNAIALIYLTFLSVLVFVYIFLIRNERQQLPRVHYIPAPTNPYSYSRFPEPNPSLFKEDV